MRSLHYYGFKSKSPSPSPSSSSSTSSNQNFKRSENQKDDIGSNYGGGGGKRRGGGVRKGRREVVVSGNGQPREWWCASHVRLPCSDRNKGGAERQFSRWYYLRTLLRNSQETGWRRDIFLDVVKALHGSDSPYGEKAYWMPLEEEALEKEEEEEEEAMQQEEQVKRVSTFYSSAVPSMMQCALDMPRLFPESIPLLTSMSQGGIVQLRAEQIFCILVHMLFGTWPRRAKRFYSYAQEYGRYASASMVHLMQMATEDGGSGTRRAAKAQCAKEKLKTLVHYFERMAVEYRNKEQHLPNDLNRNVEFELVVLTRSQIPQWDQSSTLLTVRTASSLSTSIDAPIITPATATTDASNSRLDIQIIENGSMEDYQTMEQGETVTHVDFANRYIGGGVLGGGCVQEEIEFLIHPECIASRLFMEEMDDNEAIIIRNARRFANYSGYSSSYQFESDYPAYHTVELCAIDAIDFSNLTNSRGKRRRNGYWMQFLSKYINRELNKAFAGFSAIRGNVLCTGHWGCGAFGGDKHLKCLIQLMAVVMINASVRKNNPIRRVVYYAFGDVHFANDLKNMIADITTLEVTISEMHDALLQYAKTYLLSVKTKSSTEESRAHSQPPTIFSHVCNVLFGTPLPEDSDNDISEESDSNDEMTDSVEEITSNEQEEVNKHGAAMQ